MLWIELFRTRYDRNSFCAGIQRCTITVSYTPVQCRRTYLDESTYRSALGRAPWGVIGGSRFSKSEVFSNNPTGYTNRSFSFIMWPIGHNKTFGLDNVSTK